jgi:BASS family bile acid:Na+ symporter
MNAVIIPQSSLALIYIGLFLIMLGVALEITIEDWRQCISRPVVLLTALVLQMVGVPAIALVLIQVVPMHPDVKTGILLVSLCPGGVMSNFFSTQAGGNTAISSVLTLISSALIPITFPFGITLFLQLQPDLHMVASGEQLKAISLLTAVIIIPALVLGRLLRSASGQFAGNLSNYLKTASLILVGIIVVGTLYSNRALLLTELSSVFPSAFLFNASLLVCGYWYGRLLQQPNKVCRTLSIELGIQNGTVALAVIPSLFPDKPGVMNVAAFWGIWHLISGFLLSQYWRITSERRLVFNE